MYASAGYESLSNANEGLAFISKYGYNVYDECLREYEGTDMKLFQKSAIKLVKFCDKVVRKNNALGSEAGDLDVKMFSTRIIHSTLDLMINNSSEFAIDMFPRVLQLIEEFDDNTPSDVLKKVFLYFLFYPSLST